MSQAAAGCCAAVRAMKPICDPAIRLWSKAGFGPAWPVGRIVFELADLQTSVWVAEAEGKPVGFCVWRRARRGLKLRWVEVSPYWRRLGVGRALVSAWPPHWPLVALVPDDDLRAHLFLRACGWRAVRVLHRRGGCFYGFARRPSPTPQYRE